MAEDASSSRGLTAGSNDKDRKLTAAINFLILITSLLIGGLLALRLGKDLDFDLANYHFYNAYAFLNHRWSENYWPPSYIHVFFPPTADLLTYALINTFSAKQAVFLEGAIHGLNLWILFHIALNFVSRKYYPVATAFVIALIGMCGPLGFLGIGNFKNDHVVSIFILGMVYLQIKFWQNYSRNSKWQNSLLFLAAFLLGFGAELKLTANVYLLSYFIVLLLMPLHLYKKLKIILISGIASAIGIFTSAGYWMIIQWQQYRNPMFPFLNNIFQSVDFPAINFRYLEYQPDGLWQKIIYPIYVSLHGTNAENHFTDFRYVFLFVFCSIALVCAVVRKFMRSATPRRMNLDGYWFLLFVLFSYFICLTYFGALRYIISLEMLAPLLLLILIDYIFASDKRYLLLTSLYIVILVTFSPAIVGTRGPWWHGKGYFDVTIPETISKKKEALVLMPFTMFARSNDPRPQAYLIPFLPIGWRYIGIQFHSEQYIAPNQHIDEKIRKLINNASGPFYVMSLESTLPELYRAAASYNLMPTNKCDYIYGQRQLFTGNVVVCEMIRLSVTSKNIVKEAK